MRVLDADDPGYVGIQVASSPTFCSESNASGGGGVRRAVPSTISCEPLARITRTLLRALGFSGRLCRSTGRFEEAKKMYTDTIAT